MVTSEKVVRLEWRRSERSRTYLEIGIRCGACRGVQQRAQSGLAPGNYGGDLGGSLAGVEAGQHLDIDGGQHARRLSRPREPQSVPVRMGPQLGLGGGGRSGDGGRVGRWGGFGGIDKDVLIRHSDCGGNWGWRERGSRGGCCSCGHLRSQRRSTPRPILLLSLGTGRGKHRRDGGSQLKRGPVGQHHRHRPRRPRGQRRQRRGVLRQQHDGGIDRGNAQRPPLRGITGPRAAREVEGLALGSTSAELGAKDHGGIGSWCGRGGGRCGLGVVRF